VIKETEEVLNRIKSYYKMTVAELSNLLGLKPIAGETGMGRQISGGYVSDLLSDVMGRIKNGNIWITMQSHMNVVAIAALRDVPAVIIVNGTMPSPEVIQKANDEGVTLLVTSLNAFETAGIIYKSLKIK